MTMERILWADDEIDLLTPHILFLRRKGYEVDTVASGLDALEAIERTQYALVILDENMPGLSGLDTLRRIGRLRPDLPVIMATKSEEEHIMEEAIGARIADYLVKPVNLTQILSSVKKVLHRGELVAASTSSGYRSQFSAIENQIGSARTMADWQEVYSQLVGWQLELTRTDSDMMPMYEGQRAEAQRQFVRFVMRNYGSWLRGADDAPLLSPGVMRRAVFPRLDAGRKVFFILIDNFRLDQWRAVQPIVAEQFSVSEDLCVSILPTATQFARNALFAGVMPSEISRRFPDWWSFDDSEESLNAHEAEFLEAQLTRAGRRISFSYNKINDSEGTARILKQLPALKSNQLNVLVINFVDMLSHAPTENRTMRELARTDAAYLSLTASWFRHSQLMDLLRGISRDGFDIIITTDHGTVRVDNPVRVVGTRELNTNLRYKVGKNMDYNPRQVFEMHRPGDFGLPAPNIMSSYICALGHDFLAYPNNFNHYAQLYSGTFQHGGISMEEMILPLIALSPK